MQEVPNIGLDVIEDLVHSRAYLKVNLKDMACILVLGLRTLEQTLFSLKLDMGLKESKAKENGVQPSEGLLNILNPDYVFKCNKVVDIGDAEVVASMNLHDDEGHKTTSELGGNGGHNGEQIFELVLEWGYSMLQQITKPMKLATFLTPKRPLWKFLQS
jgi:hypothetical protein